MYNIYKNKVKEKNMCKINLNVEDKGIISVESPFNRNFISEAKKLGARWNASNKTWDFPSDLEMEIKSLLMNIYGYGEETVDVVININSVIDDQILSIKGRDIVTRRQRDWDVTLNKGVSILEGEFSDSGGSRANPRICDFEGKLLVRDVPKSYLKDIEDNKYIESYEIRKNEEKNPYDEYSKDELLKMKELIEKALKNKKEE